MPSLGPLPDVYAGLGVAVAIGLLLGMQRERQLQERRVRGLAGARTFPLVALFGGVTTLLTPPDGVPWITAAGFLGLAALVVAGYVHENREKASMGLTSETLLLLTYALGATAVRGSPQVATIVGAAALVLVGLKQKLHGLAGTLTDEDERAALKFVAVALLVLPFLPDQDMGPFDAINPYKIGRLAVLVAAVSFVGYVAGKLVDARRGILAVGLLGGLASSTATTAAFARRSKESAAHVNALAAGTLAACLVSYPRVIVLAWFVSPAFVQVLWPYLTAMAAVTVAAAVVGLVGMLRSPTENVPIRNPFELAPAIWFALLFTVVVVVARGAQVWLGDAGLYVAAALTGLTDVDAMTLSAASLVGKGPETETLAKAATIAVMANALSKALIAVTTGSRAFAVRVAAGLLLSVVAGLVTFFAL
jgi:uncharacterized membrane protein (DUF4010 family)